MATVLRLTVLTGPHKNEKFCFCGDAQCLIGRAADCFVQLAGTPRDSSISRHHCQLIFKPPTLMMQDLASQNGTFINGTKVESAELAMNSTADCQASETQLVFNQGDLLTTGGTTFKMELVECPPRDQGIAEESFWEKGETAKKGCPIRCT